MAGDSPLLDCLYRYAAKQPARFHMPGHKGLLPPPFAAIAPLDVTELPATADLYGDDDEQSPLRTSERHMASVYGAADCLYLTGGATQGIMTALAALTVPGDTIWTDRLCHRSVCHAMALLDLRPVYLWRETLSPFAVSGAFEAMPDTAAKACIYTDPSYYGIIAPPPETPKTMPRIRDAAHGGALPFLHAWRTTGDALTVVSAHKTLPALGQSAFLLSEGRVSHALLRERAALFGTASPSFVLLASLDAAQAYLRKGGGDAWAAIEHFHNDIGARHGHILSSKRFPHIRTDPAKLCVYTGQGRADACRLEAEQGLVCELADNRNLLFMLSPQNRAEDLLALSEALEAQEVRALPPAVSPPRPAMAATPREALFGLSERIPLHRAKGRIAAQALAMTPPGIPLVAAGERFDKITLDFCRALCYDMDGTINVLL